MKNRIDILAMFPFSFNCASKSSVDIGPNKPVKSKSETRREETEEGSSKERVKSYNWALLAIPKTTLVDAIYRLAKSFRNLSQLFAYTEEEEEEMEIEMEIGLPTDVKHVTHIGWDGTTTTNPVTGWENLIPPELLSLPSISMKQFELAMDAQANQPASRVDTLNLENNQWKIST